MNPIDKIEKYVKERMKYYSNITSYTDEEYYANISRENLCEDILDYIQNLKKEINNDTN